MPTAWDTLPLKFEGGWITNLGRLEQGIDRPGSATILQNFEASTEGGYKRILGYDKYSSSPVPGTGLIKGIIAEGLIDAIVYREDKLYLGSSGSWTLKATAPISGADFLRHDTYNFNGTSKTIMVDGVNKPAIYDSGTNLIAYDTSALSDVQGAQNVKVFRNHIFIAKGSNLYFLVPFTDNNYDTGAGAGVINTGDEITGLIVFRDQLIVFGADRIQRVSGTNVLDFVLSPIATSSGCLSADSIQEVGGDVMYLGPDGVRWLSATERIGDFGLERASEAIQTDVLSSLGSGNKYCSLVVRAKNQYRIFSYLNSLTKDSSEGYIGTKFSDQSTINIQWSKIRGMKVSAADSKQFQDRERILFISDTGYVYKMEFGNSFDGDDIEAIFETPYMSITDPKIRKTIYKHTLYTKVTGSFHVDVSLRFDYGQPNVIQPRAFTLGSDGSKVFYYGDPISLYGTATFSTELQDLYINNTVGSGFTVALRYTDKSTKPAFLLEYAVLEFSQDERR